ncbi:hypothetical protein F1847_08930 [Thermodesulfobacterium sp. TA1]|uniref:hypothetical protein n=1 Tax=Thermodesulfobacterium sp. TA1 TaxID=2234087 RepID=UPI0012327369|nr:hypothetical protein [Thermodesulfobacterium sp. TA1]QER42857.1 hypothetical protein F1847_08930 [Thermodesulfobacterium sp. TA1]
MKIIAWDVDDVLNNLMESWFEWYKMGKNLNLKYQNLKENPPYKILGISLDEYLISLDEFRLSNFYQEMQPREEVLKWFKTYGEKFRHIAITSTPISTASTTSQWVFKHFGKWIRTFHFVPSSRKDITAPIYDQNKADFLKWLGKVDIFIDDNEENINQAKALGIFTILFPAPWNSSKNTEKETLELIFDSK